MGRIRRVNKVKATDPQSYDPKGWASEHGYARIRQPRRRVKDWDALYDQREAAQAKREAKAEGEPLSAADSTTAGLNRLLVELTIPGPGDPWPTWGKGKGFKPPHAPESARSAVLAHCDGTPGRCFDCEAGYVPKDRLVAPCSLCHDAGGAEASPCYHCPGCTRELPGRIGHCQECQGRFRYLGSTTPKFGSDNCRNRNWRKGNNRE